MTRAEIGFAIVGTGVAGRYHARAIAETPGARLVAACRPSGSGAAEASAELGVPCDAELDALLARPGVDAVCVCSPSGLHATHAVAAARAGKHVLVEKPMALSLAAADAVIGACREARVTLGVALQRRTEAGSRALHDAIRAGELGRMVLGVACVPYYRSPDYYESAAWRGSWELDGGGALMNQGIHLVDLLLWWMGGEVEVVGAAASTLRHSIEVEDCVVAALRFSGGARGAVVATTAAFPGFPHRVEVYGTSGGAQLEGDSIVRWEGGSPRVAPGVAPSGAGAGASPTALAPEGHRLLLADFVQSIREGGPPLVGGEEGRRSLALVLGVYAAAGIGPRPPGANLG